MKGFSEKSIWHESYFVELEPPACPASPRSAATLFSCFCSARRPDWEQFPRTPPRPAHLVRQQELAGVRYHFLSFTYSGKFSDMKESFSNITIPCCRHYWMISEVYWAIFWPIDMKESVPRQAEVVNSLGQRRCRGAAEYTI